MSVNEATLRERCGVFLEALWGEARECGDEVISMTLDGVLLGLSGNHERLSITVFGGIPHHEQRLLLERLSPARLPTYEELRSHLSDVVDLPYDPGDADVDPCSG
jgi:hypothetical protein